MMLTTNDRDNDNMDNGNTTRNDAYNGNYDKENQHIDNDDENDGIYDDRDNIENGKRGQL